MRPAAPGEAGSLAAETEYAVERRWALGGGLQVARGHHQQIAE